MKKNQKSKPIAKGGRRAGVRVASGTAQPKKRFLNWLSAGSSAGKIDGSMKKGKIPPQKLQSGRFEDSEVESKIQKILEMVKERELEMLESMLLFCRL